MRAVRNFVCSRDRRSRMFRKGDEIPDDWVAFVGTQSLVDEPLPHLAAFAGARSPADQSLPDLEPEPPAPHYPEFGDMITVEAVMGWVAEVEGAERTARARFALAAEEKRKTGPRRTLIPQLRDVASAQLED